MKHVPGWLRELASSKGCRIEHRMLGYDLICGGDRIYVARLNRDCSTTTTYAELREMRMFQPLVWVYDAEQQEIVAEMSFLDYLEMLSGVGRKIIVASRGCLLRPRIVAGRMGREVRIIVSDQLYRKWMSIVEYYGDYERAFEKLLEYR